MKDSTKERIEQEITGWTYMEQLPAEWYGFHYVKNMKITDDVYDLYSYENEMIHRSVTTYYHEETNEYKLRVRIGLTEFCLIEYIASSLSAFEQLLRNQFSDMLHDLAEFNNASISSIVREKDILNWDYTGSLPLQLEGFSLFIRPDEPVRVLNGSYIIFDYSDFTIESNFIIYYNVFRDEFFGEARIRQIPDMNYLFDSTELAELEEKLRQYLIPRLKEIRQKALQQT